MPLCPYCGTDNREGAAFCVSCRRTIEPGEWLRPRTAPPPPVGAEPWDSPYYHRTPYQQPMYTLAAFWPRAGAWLLDLLFSTLLGAIPGVILAIVLALAVASSQDEAFTQAQEDENNGNIVIAAIAGFALGFYPVQLAYYTIANAKGGGWGKRIVGLRILRQRDGAPPGYGTGFLRTIAPSLIGLIPLVSYILVPLNYLWCIWDSQKQCWHDKMAGTIVVVAR